MEYYPSSLRYLQMSGVGQWGSCKRLMDCEGELRCCMDRGLCLPNCDLKQENETCDLTNACDFGLNCC